MKRKANQRAKKQQANDVSDSSTQIAKSNQPSSSPETVIADALKRYAQHLAASREPSPSDSQLPIMDDLWWNEGAWNAVQEAVEPFQTAADYLVATHPELEQPNEDCEQKLLALAWAENEAKRLAYAEYLAKHPEQMPIDTPDRLRRFIDRERNYAQLSVVAYGGTYGTYDFTKVNDQAWEHARVIYAKLPSGTPSPPKPEPIGAPYYLEQLAQWCTEAAHAEALAPYHKMFEGKPTPTPHELRMMEIASEVFHRKALERTADGMSADGLIWDETDPDTSRICTLSARQNAILEAARDRIETPDEVPQHRWPTLSDLLSVVTVSPHTVRRIRIDAGMDVSRKGAAAQRQRFSPRDIDRMIEAAHAGLYRERHDIEAAWEKWTTPEAARKRQGGAK